MVAVPQEYECDLFQGRRVPSMQSVIVGVKIFLISAFAPFAVFLLALAV